MTDIQESRTTDRLPARDEVLALSAAGGDAELAAELYAAFRSGLPGDLAELRRQCLAGDWSGLADTAHRVRSACRYCGAPALDEALGALEPLARSGRDHSKIGLVVDWIEREARRLLAMPGG